MPLRDLALFLVVAVVVPWSIKHPYVGGLAWVWLGLMNPQALAFGPARGFPFAQAVALATVAGAVLTKDQRKWKGGAAAIVLVFLAVWVSITTVFAFAPAAAQEQWVLVMKVLFMTFMLLMLLHTKQHVEMLVYVMAASIAFFGVKGGVFAIATGGAHMVMGPDGGKVAGNNGIGAALAIVIPLLVFIYQESRNRYLRWGMLASIVLCCISILSTYSRGAFLAVAGMLVLLWLRSNKKLPIALVAVLFVVVLVPFMPERWDARMGTILDYQGDGSAMSRLTTWETAFNVAVAHPVLGLGFEYYSPEVSARYSPDPSDWRVAHSIYFQVLGSQGFVGFAAFLLFWGLVWAQCSQVRRHTRGNPDLSWAFSLASMTQVGLVAYLIGGAFLDLAFWDFPYYLFVAVAVTRHIVLSSAQETPLSQSASAIPASRSVASVR